MSQRAYPADADIRLSARTDSRRFYFDHPEGGRVSIPSMDLEQARKLAADEYPDLSPEDFTSKDCPECGAEGRSRYSPGYEHHICQECNHRWNAEK